MGEQRRGYRGGDGEAAYPRVAAAHARGHVRGRAQDLVGGGGEYRGRAEGWSLSDRGFGAAALASSAAIRLAASARRLAATSGRSCRGGGEPGHLAANRAPGDARVMGALGDALWSSTDRGGTGGVFAAHARTRWRGRSRSRFIPSRLCHRRRPAQPEDIRQRHRSSARSFWSLDGAGQLAVRVGAIPGVQLHYAGMLAEFGRVRRWDTPRPWAGR